MRYSRNPGVRRARHRLAPTKSLFAAVSVLLMLAGCATTPVAPPVSVAPSPVTAEELVAKLQEREAAVRTLKALFTVEASGSALKSPQRMEAALIYQRPGNIRLQTFARLGFPLFDLLLSEGQYQLRFPLQGTTQKGAVSDLDHKSGVDAPVTLGLQAIMGSLGGVIVSTDQVSLREEQNQYVVDVMASSDRTLVARRLWVSQQTLNIVRQDLFDVAGHPMATMTYQDYRVVGTTSAGPLAWPSRVFAEGGMKGGVARAKLTITFHDIVPNPELAVKDWGPLQAGRQAETVVAPSGFTGQP